MSLSSENTFLPALICATTYL